MLILSSASFYLYRFEGGAGRIINSSLMTFSGIFVNGAYNLISSAIAADLGTHSVVKGNKTALATVTGIIDGTGSFGAAIGQVLIAWISSRWGWNITFYVLIIIALLSAVCILPLFLKEIRIFIRYQRGFSFLF